MGDIYLGRSVGEDLQETGSALSFDPDRLTRHAVCFGMTGSGKTGFCVTLLEELAMQGVPLIVLDPKGDMANLALAFAEHRAQDFEPWIDAAEAEREGRTVAEQAEKLASRWREGLAAHQVDEDRIRAFTDGADVKVYTPGSTAGIPVDVLGMLRAPGESLDDEVLRDLVKGTVSALLGLVGVDADPVKDPQHVLFATLLEHAWRAGNDLDLEGLILGLVDPPFDKIGVFPVDTFFPRKDRMKLAMDFNGVVASPSFSVWSQGQALDIDALLDTSQGTPVRVFTMAHLDASERMFFASTLLNQIVAWSRRQPGSSALRALVYFDEVYGFLPPYPKNPPTKAPVLTLMKQARAVGVGTMLVTQNPVDVDYSAMSNAGLWVMGRLQTEQDRDRVLDGLAGATGALDRKQLGSWLEALPSRTFLVKDVKEPEPFLVKSRWAISYLRGPLTRLEIERLEQQAPSAPAPSTPRPARTSRPVEADDGLLEVPPPPPSGEARFLDPAVAFSARLGKHFEAFEEERREDDAVVWRAGLYARLHLRFDERDFELERDEHRFFFPIDDDRVDAGFEPAFEPGDLLPSPPAGGRFHPLPASIDEARELAAMEKRVKEDVYRGETESMFRQADLKVYSRAGETEEAFRERVGVAIQDRIDARVAKLADQTERKVERLEAKQRKLELDISTRESDVSGAQTAEVLNIAETAFSWFMGRRRSVSSAMTKRNQTRRASERLDRAKAELSDLERELYDLDVELQDEILQIRNQELRSLEAIEKLPVGLERADVRLDELTVVWVPVTRGY